MKNPSRIFGVDSFRFLAFLNVFIYHATSRWPVGFLGTQLFFVLSSFLLTLLALQEIRETGTFSRRNFFIRRALRIYPLYFLILAGSFYVLPVLASVLHYRVSLPDHKWLYWVFLANFEKSDHIFALKFLWSISVEEQFYLLFLGLSFFFRKHIYAPIAFLFLLHVCAPFLGRFLEVPLYYNPLFYFSNFGAGMLAAKLYTDRHIILSKRWLLPVGISSSLVAGFTYFEPSLILVFSISFSVAAAISLVAMIRFFQWRPLFQPMARITEKLGRYTYGLYVYSGFVISFSGILFRKIAGEYALILEIAVLLGIVYLSYHLFEKPFLNLKSLFRRNLNRPPQLPSLKVPKHELA